jgi:hypothetical protein
MWRRVVDKALGPLVDLLYSKPERAALRFFREKNPENNDAWCSLVGVEPDKFVVTIFYGSCEPPRYLFISVPKDRGLAEELIDDSAYRPRGWR